MENATTLAAVMGPIYLMVGLSVLFYAKSWQKLIRGWEKDHYGLFSLMLVYAVLGLLVVRSYNVWEWNLWLLVTLTGWAMLVKSVAYFLLPGDTIREWIKVGGSDNMIYLGGVVATVVGVALSYNVYF